MIASGEIYQKVTRVLVEALNVDEDDVTPAATLQGNLGAESIDFLDIVFRLEREFGIRIPRGELFPESVFQGDAEFVCEGKVTDQGIAELQSRMPYADLGSFDHDRRLSAVPDLFTVDLITRYIAWKLRQDTGSNPNDQAVAPATRNASLGYPSQAGATGTPASLTGEAQTPSRSSPTFPIQPLSPEAPGSNSVSHPPQSWGT
jgi:acyl carrier protein